MKILIYRYLILNLQMPINCIKRSATKQKANSFLDGGIMFVVRHNRDISIFRYLNTQLLYIPQLKKKILYWVQDELQNSRFRIDIKKP